MARPFQRVKWTMEMAAKEFGINPKTLSGRLKQAGIDPGADGHWTTVQIVRAIYSDLESERIRKTRAEADVEELTAAKMRGEMVDVSEFRRRFDGVFASVGRIVKSSGLPTQQQDELLGGISKILADSGRQNETD